MIHLLLSSIASFSWVWWIHEVTLASDFMGMLQTMKYGLFYIVSEFYAHMRSLGWYLWTVSDMGNSTTS